MMKPNPTSSDFFERLGLPEQYTLEEGELRKAYFQLQQQFHPDRAGTNPTVKTQAAIMAANVNEAYHALKDPLLRAKYLLHLNGVEVNGERDTLKPSQSLLIEVMEWRERAEEAKEKNPLKIDLARLEEIIRQDIAVAFKQSAWHKAGELAMRWHYLRKTLAEIRDEHAA